MELEVEDRGWDVISGESEAVTADFEPACVAPLIKVDRNRRPSWSYRDRWPRQGEDRSC